MSDEQGPDAAPAVPDRGGVAAGGVTRAPAPACGGAVGAGEVGATRPWVAVNINDTMRFRLTERGKQIWLDYWRKYPGARPTLPPEEDGWFSEQIWNVMSILGAHFSNGGPLVMETEILIKAARAEGERGE